VAEDVEVILREIGYFSITVHLPKKFTLGVFRGNH
jgi:hypothetical protein